MDIAPVLKNYNFGTCLGWTLYLISDSWERLTLCKKVQAVALSILAYPSLLTLDFVFTMASLAIKICSPSTPAKPLFRPSPPSRTPNTHLINRIIVDPYEFEFAPLSSEALLRRTIRTALEFLTPDMRTQYQDLIQNQGIPNEGEARIDIFHWAAKTLLANHCRTVSLFDAYRFYPAKHPARDTAASNSYEIYAAHERDVKLLRVQYKDFSREEQAAAFLKLIDPETDWALTKRTKDFIDQANARALEMCRDPYFIKIYKEAVRHLSF